MVRAVSEISSYPIIRASPLLGGLDDLLARGAPSPGIGDAHLARLSTGAPAGPHREPVPPAPAGDDLLGERSGHGGSREYRFLTTLRGAAPRQDSPTRVVVDPTLDI